MIEPSIYKHQINRNGEQIYCSSAGQKVRVGLLIDNRVKLSNGLSLKTNEEKSNGPYRPK